MGCVEEAHRRNAGGEGLAEALAHTLALEDGATARALRHPEAPPRVREPHAVPAEVGRGRPPGREGHATVPAPQLREQGKPRAVVQREEGRGALERMRRLDPEVRGELRVREEAMPEGVHVVDEAQQAQVALPPHRVLDRDPRGCLAQGRIGRLAMHPPSIGQPCRDPEPDPPRQRRNDEWRDEQLGNGGEVLAKHDEPP